MNQQAYWNNFWKQKLPPKKEISEFAKEANQIMKQHSIKTMLDIGCGAGQETIYFAKKGYKVTAIDLSTNALLKLRQQIQKENIQNIETKILDITKKRITGKYDAIYSELSIHYFNDTTTKLIITKIKTALNKNGLLFIRCKSTQNTAYKKGTLLEENFYEYQGKQMRLFTLQYMEELLKNYSMIKIKETKRPHYTKENKEITIHSIEAIVQKP
ncbi:class I SAM-dependent methyltransferase [Candidatus Woesearchaeota archaeon]|nr:class I SAM-dependent methyltransferase [Candidatus Woesearchaeota archaeon]